MKTIILTILTIITFMCQSVVEGQVVVEKATEVQFEDGVFLPQFTQLSPKDGLLLACSYYDVAYPEIVYRQAVLETGHFTSSLCCERNNLFGLYDSANQKFMEFEFWWESVIAYKQTVQYKFEGDLADEGSYYRFLDELPYAEDTLYVYKLKHIRL